MTCITPGPSASIAAAQAYVCRRRNVRTITISAYFLSRGALVRLSPRGSRTLIAVAQSYDYRRGTIVRLSPWGSRTYFAAGELYVYRPRTAALLSKWDGGTCFAAGQSKDDRRGMLVRLSLWDARAMASAIAAPGHSYVFAPGQAYT